MKCENCGVERWDKHSDEHPGECCDCYDLSWAPEKLDQINEERKKVGRPPLSLYID